MHSAAMNTGVQVAVSAFNSLVYTPRSRVARSMVIVPLTLSKLHTSTEIFL